MRFYGYLKGPEGSLKGEMADAIKETVAVLHNAALEMWRDASILSNAATGLYPPRFPIRRWKT